MNIQSPTLSLLVKLGSIAVHADEFISPNGHDYDKIAIQSLLKDKEVIEWLSEMDKAQFLPKKRQ